MERDEQKYNEVFIYETLDSLTKLEALAGSFESAHALSHGEVDEIFRMLHTIKGSSSMMSYPHITRISHLLENIFSKIRDQGVGILDSEHQKELYDLTLEAIDFIRSECTNSGKSESSDNHFDLLVLKINSFISVISNDTINNEDLTDKKCRKLNNFSMMSAPLYLKIRFEPDTGMEEVRALLLIHALSSYNFPFHYYPDQLEANTESRNFIIKNGFFLSTDSREHLEQILPVLSQYSSIRSYKIIENTKTDLVPDSSLQNSFVRVSIDELDDISTQIDFLRKSCRDCSSTITDLLDKLQASVMELRQTSLSPLILKMEHLVHDMSEKLHKDIRLESSGCDIEVDKPVADSLMVSFMHIIRNAVTHGIEDSADDRTASGKPAQGCIQINAVTTPGELTIAISDDGRGIDEEKVLAKALERGIIKNAHKNYSSAEIANLLTLPGFSTNKTVDEYSGRGVGLDVVKKGMEDHGGRLDITSVPGKGTTILLHFPL